MPYSPETVMIRGPAGMLEAAVAMPQDAPRRAALVAHPHPLHGGTMTNKVAQTLCRALHSLGYLAATVNFRGVGKSEGEHDFGVGEAHDIVALAEHVRTIAGTLPITLAGFSFGGGVQARVCGLMEAEQVLLVAPSVPEDVAPAKPAPSVLCAFDDDVIPSERVFSWSRENHADLTVLPHAGHFFHGKLHLVADWTKARATTSVPKN